MGGCTAVDLAGDMKMFTSCSSLSPPRGCTAIRVEVRGVQALWHCCLALVTAAQVVCRNDKARSERDVHIHHARA